MSSKLQEVRKSTSTTVSTVSKDKKTLPKGAIIISKSIRIETEPIENGFLVTKKYDITYKKSADKDAYNDYLFITKKWFSKEDPLTITTDNKSLAEAFKED